MALSVPVDPAPPDNGVQMSKSGTESVGDQIKRGERMLDDSDPFDISLSEEVRRNENFEIVCSTAKGGLSGAIAVVSRPHAQRKLAAFARLHDSNDANGEETLEQIRNEGDPTCRNDDPKTVETDFHSHHEVYRADVDGLRAVAVSSVIVYHLDHTWLPGGFIGVDVFFVISGFVVSGSLVRQRAAKASELLVRFYSRRVRRLTPALACCVLCTSLSMSFLMPPERVARLDDFYESGQLGLLGWANNHFAARGHGYDDDGPDGLELNPFTHLWSLGVEEQVWPLACKPSPLRAHESRANRCLHPWLVRTVTVLFPVSVPDLSRVRRLLASTCDVSAIGARRQPHTFAALVVDAHFHAAAACFLPPPVALLAANGWSPLA